MKIQELVEKTEYTAESSVRCRVVSGEFQYYNTPNCRWEVSDMPYNQVRIMSFTECEFEPKESERFYYPSFECKDGYSWCYWHEGECCEKVKRLVGAYRTKEKAIEKARELGWVE